jgi:hypothetical protein
MSINAMTTAAVGFRRTAADTKAPDLLRRVNEAERAGATGDQGALASALEALVAYIPTEVVTAYVAVLAAIHSDDATRAGQWAAFYFFMVSTPFAVWATFAVKLRAGGEALPVHPRAWPWWELIASTIAFGSWAYTLPDSPFADWSWYQPNLGAALILIVTFLLGLLAPLFQPKCPGGPVVTR